MACGHVVMSRCGQQVRKLYHSTVEGSQSSPVDTRQARLVLKVSVMNIKVYVNTAAVLDVNTAVIFAPETRLKAKTEH